MSFNTGGNKKNWMLAIDAAGQQTGWVENGTWTVPCGCPEESYQAGNPESIHPLQHWYGPSSPW